MLDSDKFIVAIEELDTYLVANDSCPNLDFIESFNDLAERLGYELSDDLEYQFMTCYK